MREHGEDGSHGQVPEQLDLCLDVLEDKYSFALPWRPFLFDLQTSHVVNAIKRMRPTSPGPDGWTRSELISLPPEAIGDFLRVFRANPRGILRTTLLGHFRRVPLEKKEGDAPLQETSVL